MNYKDKIEIDLFDLLHYLLLKWRFALIFGVIGMIVFGAYGYYSKVPKAIEKNGELTELNDEDELASLGAKLSYNEKYEVVLAVESYLALEKSFYDELSLGNRSISMQFDVFKVPNIINSYRISDYNFDNVPLQSTVTNVDNIIALYKAAIYDQSVISKIKKANNWDYEGGFVRELYGIAKTGLDIMTVNAYAPSKKECDVIINILDQTINSVSSDVILQYEHNITKVNSMYYEGYSSILLGKQRDHNEELISIEKTMQQIPSAMDANQKAYYKALLNEVKNENINGESVDPSVIAGRELIEEQKVDSNTNEGESEHEQSIVMVQSRVISKKYLLMGLLAGVLISFCAWGLFYILSPTLKTKNELKTVFGLSELGMIINGDKYKKVFGRVDKFIDLLFMKNDMSLTQSECMDIISLAICLRIKNEDLKNLYIISTKDDNKLEVIRNDLIQSIAREIENEGFCSVATGASPLINVDSLKALTSADSVILVEGIGISRYEEIGRLLEACEKYDVGVLGTVVMG